MISLEQGAATVRFFLAGIMQGSHLADVLHEQTYRDVLNRSLADAFPNAEIYDPFAGHVASLEYSADVGRNVFLGHNAMCGEVDVVVAYVPEASMGTAIEMWEAWRNGRIVFSISPLAKNWVIKFCSHDRWATLEDFVEAVESGAVAARIDELRTVNLS